jgi:hypothetical protein
MRNILTQDLCNEFQQQLVRYHYSADSLRRYIDILNDFSHFGFDQYYSQKLGVDYLVHQLRSEEDWLLPIENQGSRNISQDVCANLKNITILEL